MTYPDDAVPEARFNYDVSPMSVIVKKTGRRYVAMQSLIRETNYCETVWGFLRPCSPEKDSDSTTSHNRMLVQVVRVRHVRVRHYRRYLPSDGLDRLRPLSGDEGGQGAIGKSQGMCAHR